MMIRLTAALMALGLMFASAASAASLIDRTAALIYSGDMSYAIDIAGGQGSANNFATATTYEFVLDGFFDPGTQGANPTDVVLTLTDLSRIETVLDARGLREVEIGDGFLALLFDDLVGAGTGAFAGGQMIAILRDTAFPAETGVGTFELHRVIPLPATAPLLLAGFGALGLALRKRARRPFRLDA